MFILFTSLMNLLFTPGRNDFVRARYTFPSLRHICSQTYTQKIKYIALDWGLVQDEVLKQQIPSAGNSKAVAWVRLTNSLISFLFSIQTTQT